MSETKTKTHNRDIALVDEHCRLLKTGTKKERYKAQAEILKCFDSYFEKYTNLFSGSTVDIRNYDTRLFLAMFLTGRPKTAETLTRQRLYIVHVLRNYPREDIKADITLVFLNVLDKYRIVEGVNALNPLTKIFRWRLKDWFNKKARDVFTSISYLDSPLSESLDSNSSNEILFEDFIEPDGYALDFNWIVNPLDDIYGSVYCELSPYERYLIYLVFKQNKALSDIALLIDRDKDTIKKHLRAAFKTLRAAALVNELTIESREDDD